MPLKENTAVQNSDVRAALHTDHEVRLENEMSVNESHLDQPLSTNIKYALVGILFGIVLVKAEIISWFRIQEMFKLQSFHMYGVIGSAIVVGMVGVALIKKFGTKSIEGEPIYLENKKFHKGQVFGGLIFGLGWAITGACPGPLFAQVGTGATVIVVSLVSAIAGTWVYGYVRERLPH